MSIFGVYLCQDKFYSSYGDKDNGNTDIFKLTVLSNGNWYRITTNQNGIYKLNYSDFEALGVNTSNLSISAIKLYGNGGGMLPHLNSDFRYSNPASLCP